MTMTTAARINCKQILPSRKRRTQPQRLWGRLAQVVLPVLLATGVSTTCVAQNATWKNGTGGSFDTGANWDIGSVPGISNDVFFGLSDSYGVRLNRAENANRFEQTNGDVQFFGGNSLTMQDSALVEKSNFTVTDAGTQFIVGTSLSAENEGVINVTNGAAVSTNAGYLGGLTSSNGFANVSGTNSVWRSQELLMGAVNQNTDAGTGILNIIGGGHVHIGDDGLASSNSELIISHSNSSGGSLIVRNGSQINTEYTTLGRSSGYTGELLVNGAGSSLTNSQSHIIGLDGNGFMGIGDGGKVTSSLASYIGTNSFSYGNVDVQGIGSRWEISNDLIVGQRGSAGLQIRDEGVVENRNGYIGQFAGSDGDVDVRNNSRDGSTTICILASPALTMEGRAPY